MMLHVLILVASGAALVSGAVNFTVQELAAPGTKNSWHVSVNGNQYYFYGEEAFQINMAQGPCQNMGGSLIWFDGEEEYNWFGANGFDLYRKYQTASDGKDAEWIFLGCRRSSGNSFVNEIDGSNCYLNWIEGEPNNFDFGVGEPENCVEFGTSLLMNDLPCRKINEVWSTPRIICKRRDPVATRDDIDFTVRNLVDSSQFSVSKTWQIAVNGNDYYFSGVSVPNYNEALSKCAQIGGFPIWFDSMEERQWFRANWRGYVSQLGKKEISTMWYGCNDANLEGVFRSSFDNTLCLTDWLAPNEPNDETDEDCVEMIVRVTNNYFNDVACGGTADNVYALGCKRRSPSTSTTSSTPSSITSTTSTSSTTTISSSIITSSTSSSESSSSSYSSSSATTTSTVSLSSATATSNTVSSSSSSFNDMTMEVKESLPISTQSLSSTLSRISPTSSSEYTEEPSDTNDAKDNSLQMVLIIVIVCGIVFACIVIVICRRRSRTKNQNAINRDNQPVENPMYDAPTRTMEVEYAAVNEEMYNDMGVHKSYSNINEVSYNEMRVQECYSKVDDNKQGAVLYEMAAQEQEEEYEQVQKTEVPDTATYDEISDQEMKDLYV
eukprot:m.88575 g.88575  ORF g.88575 m.88575 type:complete len:608 (+) comp13174_c0_seq3:151-1974(+)